MKKKTLAILLVFVLCALALSGCAPKLPSGIVGDILDSVSSAGNAGQGDADEPSAPAEGGSPAGGGASGESIGISAIADEWSRLSALHEGALNSYDNMNNLFLPLQLVGPELTLAMCVQYDLLNVNNANGRFDGALMFNGQQAFVERTGMKLVFGSDHTVPEGSASGSQEPGDRLVEDGEADLAKLWLKSEGYTERGGAKITRSYIEVIKMSDGSMALISLSGSVDEDGQQTAGAVFIRSGEDVYEYVVASSEAGVDFPLLSLGGGYDRAAAKSALEGAGYTVTDSGAEVNGKLVSD